MIVADIVGPWHSVEATDAETGATYTERRRVPQFLHDVSDSIPWRDVTAQLAEVIPPTPGLCAWRVWCTEAQLEQFVTLPGYEVLRAAEVDSANVDPGDWPERAIAGDAGDGAFPPLPDSGWLEQGEVYLYGEQAVIVRQSHNRTHYAPGDTPALFMVWRDSPDDVLDWVAGEQVFVGTQRRYNGVLYECRQAHVTQSDWTPPATPALWAVVQEEPDEPEPTIPEWKAGVAYKVGDVVTYQGPQYQCRQAHTSQVGWEPPKVLALWLPL